MPSSFLGLFILSTALSLVATFTAVSVQTLLRRTRRIGDDEHPRLR